MITIKESIVAFEAEIEKLQAIVARLPKTADGVPVVPGMDVWFTSPSPHCALVYQIRMDGEIATNFHGSLYKTVQATEVYSTRKAAEDEVFYVSLGEE